jgi:hypothetical protein
MSTEYLISTLFLLVTTIGLAVFEDPAAPLGGISAALRQAAGNVLPCDSASRRPFGRLTTGKELRQD